MAEEQGPPPTAARLPPETIETIFVDNILTASYAPGVIKFYFGRADATFGPGEMADAVRPVMQVVIPLPGFVDMSMFFAETIERLMAAKVLTPEFLEFMREQRKNRSRT